MKRMQPPEPLAVMRRVIGLERSCNWWQQAVDLSPPSSSSLTLSHNPQYFTCFFFFTFLPWLTFLATEDNWSSQDGLQEEKALWRSQGSIHLVTDKTEGGICPEFVKSALLCSQQNKQVFWIIDKGWPSLFSNKWYANASIRSPNSPDRTWPLDDYKPFFSLLLLKTYFAPHSHHYSVKKFLIF